MTLYLLLTLIYIDNAPTKHSASSDLLYSCHQNLKQIDMMKKACTILGHVMSVGITMWRERQFLHLFYVNQFSLLIQISLSVEIAIAQTLNGNIMKHKSPY